MYLSDAQRQVRQEEDERLRNILASVGEGANAREAVRSAVHAAGVALSLANPPGDEARERVTWLRDHVLPEGRTLDAPFSADDILGILITRREVPKDGGTGLLHVAEIALEAAIAALGLDPWGAFTPTMAGFTDGRRQQLRVEITQPGGA